MAENDAPSRFDTLVMVSIVVISIALSLLVWRASMLASQASGDDRTGMIDLIKQQAAINENFRVLYEEIFYLREYDLLDVRIQYLEKATDSSSQAEAKTLRQILPGLGKLSPLSTDQQYKNPDGSYKFDQRLNDLNKAFPETSLQPDKSFVKADVFYQEQRWLMVASVLMGLSLFWASLCEVLSGKLKIASYIAGVIGFVGTIGFILVIELFVLVGRVGS